MVASGRYPQMGFLRQRNDDVERQLLSGTIVGVQALRAGTDSSQAGCVAKQQGVPNAKGSVSCAAGLHDLRSYEFHVRDRRLEVGMSSRGDGALKPQVVASGLSAELWVPDDLAIRQASSVLEYGVTVLLQQGNRRSCGLRGKELFERWIMENSNAVILQLWEDVSSILNSEAAGWHNWKGTRQVKNPFAGRLVLLSLHLLPTGPRIKDGTGPGLTR
jgi:hypothetical protein